jgi:hypothetical protein
MTPLKAFYALCLLGLIAFLRLQASHASYPSHASDYGVHLAIVNELLRNPTNLLSFPPIYFGAIGGHAIVATFALLGMSVVKAFQFTSDLSIILFFLALTSFVSNKKKEQNQPLLFIIAMLAFFFISLFCLSAMITKGYFAQVCSSGFYATSLVLLLSEKRQPRLWGIALLLFATWIYPETAAVFFIGLVVNSRRFFVSNKIRLLANSFLILVVSGLTYFHAYAIELEGGAHHGFLPFVVVLDVSLVLLLISKRELSSLGKFGLPQMIAIFIIWSHILVFSHFLFQGSIAYYARKSFYSAFIFLPFWISYLWQDLKIKRELLVPIIVGLIIGSQAWMKNSDYRRHFDYILRPRGPLIASDEKCIEVSYRTTIELNCKSIIVLPNKPYRSDWDGFGQRLVKTPYYASFWGLYDLRKHVVLYDQKIPFFDFAGMSEKLISEWVSKQSADCVVSESPIQNFSIQSECDLGTDRKLFVLKR